MAATLIHAHAVVIGASRGIGLGLTKGLHEANPGKGEVVATMRVPNHTLLPQDVRVEQLDITDAASVERFASKFEAIELLIVNAAVGASTSILEADASTMRWYFESNVIGVQQIIKALVPALRKGTTKKLVYISSTDASFDRMLNTSRGMRGVYSVSKAAGNMVATQFYLALRNDKIAVGLLHPGWVATDMGKGAGDGGMPIETSVDGLIKTIDALTFETSPWFADWQGKAMPW